MSRKSLFERSWLPTAVFLVSLVLTAAAFQASSMRAEQRARDEFEHVVERVQLALVQRLELYESALRGAAAFFRETDQMTSRKWRSYVDSVGLHERFPGIVGIGFIRYVEEDDLASFERERQREIPDYKVYPDGSRPYYLPITLLEPMETNSAALGFDASTSLNRLEAAFTAMHEARATITAKVTLRQDVHRSPGVVMFYPVYRSGAPADTPEAREENLEGWVFGPFVAKRLVEGMLGPQDLSLVEYELYADSDMQSGALLYDGVPGSGDAAGQSSKTLELTVPVKLYGRTWILKARALPPFHAATTSAEPEMILLGGSILSVLLLLLMRSLTQGRAHALELARGMTVDLKRARDEALLASEHKSRFVANMSHEIRTPISGANGMADLLADTELTPEQKSYLSGIKRSLAGLQAIINDVLDLSKIEAGKIELERLAFHPLELIEDIAAVIRPMARRKGLEFHVDAPDSLPEWMESDPARLRQILNNLLNNAIKFTHLGSVTLRVRCHANSRTRAELRVEVEDTGIGIPAEAQPKIFGKFAQADASTTRQYGGTGLGLAISRELAGLMGGLLDFTSVEGKGSTFRLVLPVRLVGALPAPRETSPSGTAGMRPRSGRVLVVEDHSLNRFMAQKTLERLGVESEAAEDGIEALNALEQRRFDLILMDCQMPGLDGYEVTQRIRSHSNPETRRTPVIAMTASALKGEQERCIAAGMDGYLAKPFERHQIEAVLDQWLGRSHGVLNPASIEQLRLLDADGSDTALKRCVSIFLEQTPVRIRKLSSAAAESDLTTVGKEAHVLKSTGGFLGARRLSTVSAQLEAASSKGQVDEVQALTLVLTEAFEEARQALDTLQSG